MSILLSFSINFIRNNTVQLLSPRIKRFHQAVESPYSTISRCIPVTSTGQSFPLSLFDGTFLNREHRFYGAIRIISSLITGCHGHKTGSRRTPCIRNTRFRFTYNTAPYFWTGFAVLTITGYCML